MKALFVALFLAGLLNGNAPLNAQSIDVFDHPLSPETLPAYNALCADLAGRRVIKGSFEQIKTIKRLNRTLVSKGAFIIAPELGMVWDTASPFPSVMAVGRDFIIQSVPGGEKTKLDAGGNETFLSIAETISAVFSGNARTLQEQFDNYFIETGGAGGKSWIIGLIPRDRAVRVFAERIVLKGDSGGAGGKGGVIRSIVIDEQNGNRVAYTLSDHVFPAALEAHEKALFSL